MKNKIISLFGRNPLCEWPKNYTRADIQKEVNRQLLEKGLALGTGAGQFCVGLYLGEANKDANLIGVMSFNIEEINGEGVLGFSATLVEEYKELGVEHLLCAWAATNPQWNHLFHEFTILLDDSYFSSDVGFLYDSGMFDVSRSAVGKQFRATIKDRANDLSVEETFNKYVNGRPYWQQSSSYEAKEE